MDVEQRARELLTRLEKAKRNERGHWCDARAAVDSACALLPSIIAALTLSDKLEAQAHAAIEAAQIAQRRADRSALTPPEGHVVVTRNEAGQAVTVTRQDDEGRILSVIAEFEPPTGYVLVPVEPTEEMVLAAKLFQGDDDNVDHWMEWEGVAAANQYRAMLSARPEVKP